MERLYEIRTSMAQYSLGSGERQIAAQKTLQKGFNITSDAPAILWRREISS